LKITIQPVAKAAPRNNLIEIAPWNKISAHARASFLLGNFDMAVRTSASSIFWLDPW
jgi:hypothetical protein